MNFLAHIYLSGENDQIKIGNFIADWVKGRKYDLYPKNIRYGILMHREIDTFTDSHPIVHTHKKLFREGYHKFAGVITDMLYDHILATHWNKYYPIDLNVYAQNFYKLLQQHYNYLPIQVQQFLPKLIANNRLYSYATTQGIAQAIELMSQYTSLPAQTKFAMQVWEKNSGILTQDFFIFFEQLKNHVTTLFPETKNEHHQF